MTAHEIPKPPGRPAAWLFERYVRSLVAGHFTAVHWRAGAAAGFTPQSPTEGRVLFVANHTNWWDGFLAYLAGARLGLHFHVLMDSAQLERYGMFRRIGALPMRRGSPAGAYADLELAARHLRRPSTGLWVFPQGRRRPPAEAVQSTERGAAHLALSLGAPVTIWPVAFRYGWLGEQLPEAFVWMGTPWVVDGAAAARAERRTLGLEIERRIGETLSLTDASLRQERLEDFDVLLPGKPSINKRLDRVRHMAGTLDGPFEARNG